ncbi:MAG: hypothetical protein HY905_03965 [Deltaproteobacteria bacterium]|nr:hypothetical protein [Deltaproteobacteria bacterium]
MGAPPFRRCRKAPATALLVKGLGQHMLGGRSADDSFDDSSNDQKQRVIAVPVESSHEGAKARHPLCNTPDRQLQVGGGGGRGGRGA